MKFLNQKNLIYLTIAAGPLYLIKTSFFGLPTNLLELLILLNLAIWLCNKPWLNFKKNLALLPWQLILSLGLILTGTFVSIFANNAIVIGVGILKGWFVLPLFFAYLLFEKLENKTQIEKALLAFYFSTFLVALLCLSYKLIGLVTYDNRLSAFYASPNYLAMCLAPGVLLGFYFSIETFVARKALLEKLLAVFSLSLTLLAFFYTYSYGAWLAIFLALIVSSFFAFPKKKFLYVLLFLLSFLIVATLSQLHSQKFSSAVSFSERSSLSSRLMIWQVAEKILLENPLWGIGPGNFQTKYLSLQPLFPPYLEWAVPEPHNLLLAFWLQAGLFGLIGFIFLLLFIFQTILRKPQVKEFSLDFFFLAFFLYTILHGLVDTPFWKNDLAFFFWIFLALFAVNLKIKQENTSQ